MPRKKDLSPKAKYDFALRRNSAAHQILLISKFYNKPICPADIHVINPKFRNKRSSELYRILTRMEKAEIIDRYAKDLWMINQKGINLLFAFAKQTHTPISD